MAHVMSYLTYIPWSTMPLVVGCVFDYLGSRPHSMICSTTGGLRRLFLTHWGQLANTATTVPGTGKGESQWVAVSVSND